jgi:filamentous hemagglutinin family protein
MLKKCGHLFFPLALTMAIAPAGAQVIPDRTLPSNSLVIPLERGYLVIEGGTTKGANLFHSFEGFSVPAGTIATFNNDPAIVNIFSRVTGGDISRIDGILAANGRANLFLLNPNGIVFGANASLLLGGSFVATTGESIRFADGRYSSRNPESSVLTISLPTGISVRDPGAIVVEGNGHNFYREATIGAVIPAGIDRSGLRVLPGQTISLIGGDVHFEGGLASASSGNIYLGAVGEGTVGLDPGRGFAPTYEGIDRFKAILLSRQALLDTSGYGAGEIALRGENLTLTDSSLIINSNYGTTDSGAIRLDLSGDVTLIGSTAWNITNTRERPTGRGISSQTFGSGNSASVFVNARSLTLQDNAGIGSQTVGRGRGGDLIFDVGRLEVLGKSRFDVFPIGSIVSASGVAEGRGGDIRILASEIAIREGGVISSSNFGVGRGGDVRVSAGTITVSGNAELSGNIFLSGIGTVATNTGRAGDVSIEARQLNVIDGGLVSARTLGPGDGGTLSIRAGEIDLFSNNGKETGITSSATVPGALLTEQVSLPNIGRELIGNAGNVWISAGRVTLSGSGSQIIVVNDGLGTAGNIVLDSERVVLNNGAKVSANSFARDGGNITLRTDFLGLFGGSSVTANAIAGNGGNVTIDSRGLFFDRSSRITASSELGLQGRVTLNAPNFQIAPAAVKFPSDNDFDTVAPSACVNGNESYYRFTTTGTGGTEELPGRARPRLRLEQLRGESAVGLRVVNGRVFLIGCRASVSANE